MFLGKENKYFSFVYLFTMVLTKYYKRATKETCKTKTSKTTKTTKT